MFIKKLRNMAQIVGFTIMGLLMLFGLIHLFNQAERAHGSPAQVPSLAPPMGQLQQTDVVDTTQSVTVPPFLNYQGMLRDQEGNPMSGVHTMTFRLYDRVSAPLNEAIWTETHTDVTVRDGQFSVLLGNIEPIPPVLFYGPDMFVGVKVDDFDEMVQRQRFASVPYAMYADHASSLTAPDGQAGSAVYVDDASRVGIGTTEPNAQLHVVKSPGMTETALMIDAGEQQLTLDIDGLNSTVPFNLNDVGSGSVSLAAGGGDVLLASGGGKVGIGTTSPAAPFHVKGDDPDMTLDINGASGADKVEIRFSEDGNIRSRIQHSKANDTVDVITKGKVSMHYDGADVHVGPNSGEGTLRVNGDLRFGTRSKLPILIKRISSLVSNADELIPDVSADDYDCVAASWTVRMDIDEDDPGQFTVWTYVSGRQWRVRASFWTDNTEQSKVDVICFLRGVVSEYSGRRTDKGF